MYLRSLTVHRNWNTRIKSFLRFIPVLCVCFVCNLVLLLLAVRFDTGDVPHSAPAAEVLGGGHFTAWRKYAQYNWECLYCGPTAVSTASEKTGVRKINTFVQGRSSAPLTVAARSGAWALIARTLGSWVRIPLKAWLSASSCLWCPVMVEDLAMGWSLVPWVVPNV
jgi:hypothetical protein